MFSYPVVFVDIETTGGSYRNSRVLEVAAIRVEGDVITQEFSTIIDPQSYIPSSITALTGITSQDVVGKPVFADIAYQLAEVMNDAVFIAHNVRFDYSFLKQEFANISQEFSPKLLCTVRLSRALYSDQKGHSLAKLIQRHNIAVSARHRALDDARAIHDFTRLAYSQHGNDVFTEAIARQLRQQSLPPHIDPDQISRIDDVAGVYVFRDETRVPIYIGKSVTLKKRVMSHFQSSSVKELKISQQVHHIETIKTGSELAALLLESKLIKELQPVYNRLLRRASKYAMLIKTEENGFFKITIRSGNIETGTDLSVIYGVFRNRTKAKQKVEELTRTFGLCPKLMGYEKTQGACFLYSLGRCKGACIGKEAFDSYNLRFEIALESSKIAAWNYQSAISVPINENGERVVVKNWVIIGFLNTEGEMIISDFEPSFDVDEYKIIRRFLKVNYASIQPYA